MTRTAKSKLTKQPKPRRQARGSRQPGHWLLQDAKARFSELVRRVRSEGPQHVTVHGRDEVVVIAAEGFAASKAVSRGKRSLPLCKHRRIVTSISSRGACACQRATLLCDGLAAGYQCFI